MATVKRVRVPFFNVKDEKTGKIIAGYYARVKAGHTYAAIAAKYAQPSFDNTVQKYGIAIRNLESTFRDKSGKEISGAEVATELGFPLNPTKDRPIGLTCSWDEYVASVVKRSEGRYQPASKPPDTEGFPAEMPQGTTKAVKVDWSALKSELDSVSFD